MGMDYGPAACDPLCQDMPVGAAIKAGNKHTENSMHTHYNLAVRQIPRHKQIPCTSDTSYVRYRGKSCAAQQAASRHLSLLATTCSLPVTLCPAHGGFTAAWSGGDTLFG